ncbi:hypothetical protein [Alicyclobacillus mengziensis]|uniref:Uncharacterized protein n=1 Tax=Alicyclobacillus mengziensis TaxID=2931921 RepID=A0A9X7Z8G3_9BACL|nr:hypothetical protein [Alicyclobacillus mengziensis]QSO48365.1 hypothetical protein JZ786_05090 [Alicyclobacillus mengziensis]
MNTYVEKCMLLPEQRSLIVEAIVEGKKQNESLNSLLPDFVTNTYKPRMQYDCVNTYVEEAVKKSPHTQLKVTRKTAGLHPYIVIHDTVRNVFILVSRLPKYKHIYGPSRYRGDYASSNYARLLEMGAPKDELLGEAPYQTSLSLGEEYAPFGIIVSYDGTSDAIYEGALQPDQMDWIYNEDITESIIASAHDVATFVSYKPTDVEPRLKDSANDDIVVKLKDKAD